MLTSILAKRKTAIEFQRNYSNQLVQRRNESFQQRKLNHSHVGFKQSGRVTSARWWYGSFQGSGELKGNDEDARQGSVIEQQKFSESNDEGLI